MPPRKKQKLEVTKTPSNTSIEKKKKKQKKPISTEKAVYSCWLMKSEPQSRIVKGIDVKFGLEDLQKCPNQTSCWDGVRNYEARNFMRDDMKVGHKVFFYHSNCKEPGIAGIAKIAKEAYTDHTQFDSKDPHFDKSSNKSNPTWQMVDVQYVRTLKRFVSLRELKVWHLEHKASGGPLATLALFIRSRLSVHPITQEEWDFIIKLEDETSKAG